MRDRLARMLPPAAGRPAIHTFHSLGLAILRQHGAAAGLSRGFRLASEADKASLLAEIPGHSSGKTRPLLQAISRAKRAESAPGDEIAAGLAAYQRGLMLRNLVDFDDLIRLSVTLLEQRAEIAAEWRGRYRSISVDEFQDIDAYQYRLIRLLDPQGESLCVIGDPNQAIYGFRGADASCFDRFQADYPAANIVRLTRNYRSSGTIVTAAAQLIASPDGVSSIQMTREMLDRITVHTAPSERSEAEFVVRSIEHLIGGHTFFSMDSGRANGTGGSSSFGDFAVLYRTDAQSSALVEAFDRSGIPYKKHSHAPFADLPIVQSLLGELYELPADEPLPLRLQAAAERVMASDASLDHHAIAPELRRLISLAETSAREGVRFADALAVASEADFFDPRAARVSLLTLHAAKGLEFPVVFIVGLEDGILPLRWGVADDAAFSEERRLFYVGMTRAMDRLFLCRAEERHWRGRGQELPPSPFLADVERELLKHEHAVPRRRRDENRQLKLL
jgi:superfamily I DNA/RNA helicase